MTDQLSPLAVQNAPLLRALKEGPAASPAELSERSGVSAGNVHRKLDSLENEGLIVRERDGPKHVATLTETAERALKAIDAFSGVPDAAPPMITGETLIAFDLIDPWLNNPRTQFDAASIEEMAQSIADKGVLQPIIIRPKADRYEVIIGERRRRGAAFAVAQGWRPADFAVPCLIRDISDDEADEIAGVENLQREDMHWMDEAKWYLRLSTRLSGPAIERLVGGKRGKRSIQDFIKCARELSPAEIERTYLPEKLSDGRPNPACLTYVRARDMVGDKKEAPALDLSPKLKLALLELVYAAIGWAAPKLGETIEAVLHKPPVGGPLGTLATDRKLVEYGFSQKLDGRPIVAKIKITPELAKYLEQIGWLAEPGVALRTARDAVVGELQAGALGPDEYLMPELNRPVAPERSPPVTVSGPSPHTETPTAPGPPPMVGDDPGGDDEDEEDEPVQPPTIHQADDPGDFASGPWRTTSRPAEPPPAQASLPDVKALPPFLQIVVIEIAHKISATGVERGQGTWATEVLANYYKDRRGMDLVQGHRMLAFLPMGHKTLVALTKTAREWLHEAHGVECTEAGKPVLSDALLSNLQGQLVATPENFSHTYSTPWLNDPEEATGEAAEAPAPAAPEPTPEPAADAAPKRDAFTQQILEVAAEQRVIARLAAALREARAKLGAARTRKLSGEEVGQLDALIDSALEAAAPYLNEAA